MNEILRCNSLSMIYRGNYLALMDINLSLERGKIIGLLGPNGSGKTTLIKLINGLLQPSEGEILINGMKPSPETKKIVSYLPDADFLIDSMTVKQAVEYFEDFFADFDSQRAYTMLSHLGITPSLRLKTLSKGNREKVCLILTMSRDAQLYILDEPIAGVDPAARDYVISTVLNNYNRNATIIISTHLISDIESILDQVIFLKNGQIALNRHMDDLKTEGIASVDLLFREVFKW